MEPLSYHWTSQESFEHIILSTDIRPLVRPLNRYRALPYSGSLQEAIDTLTAEDANLRGSES